MTPKDLKKRKFWDKFKKNSDSSTGAGSAGTITTVSTPTINATLQPGQIIVPRNSNITWNTVNSAGGIITYSGNSLPNYTYYTPYTLSNKNNEILDVTAEEYSEALEVAYNHIKKKREYKDDFSSLLEEK